MWNIRNKHKKNSFLHIARPPGRPLCSQVGLASELTWVGKPALETLAKPSLHSQLEGNAEQSSDRKGGIEIYIHTWGVTIWERRGHKHPHGNSS